MGYLVFGRKAKLTQFRFVWISHLEAVFGSASFFCPRFAYLGKASARIFCFVVIRQMIPNLIHNSPAPALLDSVVQTNIVHASKVEEELQTTHLAHEVHFHSYGNLSIIIRQTTTREWTKLIMPKILLIQTSTLDGMGFHMTRRDV